MKAFRSKMIVGLVLAASFIVTILIVYLADPNYYVITADGRIERAKSGEFGIFRKDAEFLVNFSGEIITEIREDPQELKNHIRSQVMQNYKMHDHKLSEFHKFGSDRERFIIFMMLRVNGSVPFYQVKANVRADDLSGLLISRYGNCGVVATRLLVLLDTFGIKGRAIVWYSPSLMGHIFVDAYDPVEDKAYLLDPTFNVWDKYEEAGGGYFDVIFKMRPEERRRYFRGSIKAFPFYIVGADGIQEELNVFRETQYLKIKDAFRSALSYEMPAALNHWKNNYPSGVPYTLDSIGLKKLDPRNFLSTKTLMERAGIELRGP